VKKDGMPEMAERVANDLRRAFPVFYDDGGAIGRRYRRQDEVGTPFGITIDGQSTQDGTVTVRDRDTLQQVRVAAEAPIVAPAAPAAAQKLKAKPSRARDARFRFGAGSICLAINARSASRRRASGRVGRSRCFRRHASRRSRNSVSTRTLICGYWDIGILLSNW